MTDWKVEGAIHGNVPGYIKVTKGRQKKWIDWDIVGKLAHIQCTSDEIAHVIGVSVHLLLKRCKEENGITFPEFLDKNRIGGKIAIRRAQFEKAINSDDTSMLIWLGKQYLGQSEKATVSVDANLETFTSLKEIQKILSSDPALLGSGKAIDVEEIEVVEEVEEPEVVEETRRKIIL